MPGSGVTVAISTFNRGRYLPESLDSLLSQEPRPDRIVVAVDGSTDETLQVLAPYEGKVEVVVLANGGKARALNHVLPTITTPYCWFFDDDDVAMPGALRALLTTLESNPQAPFAFGDWELVGASERMDGVVGKQISYAHHGLSRQEQVWRLYRECTVMMTGALLRTESVRAVGGLDESLIRGQDYDLMVRLASLGGFVHCGLMVYRWRQHAGSRGSSGQSHGSAHRVKVWAKSGEAVARYLRRHLAMTQWGPRTAGSDTMATQREAYFRRAWALGPKQSIQLTLADLAAGLESAPELPLTETEQELVTMALSHDFVTFRPMRHLFAALLLPRVVGTSAVMEGIARGLRWLAVGEKERWGRTRLLLAAAFMLAGARLLSLIGSGHTRS